MTEPVTSGGICCRKIETGIYGTYEEYVVCALGLCNNMCLNLHYICQ